MDSLRGGVDSERVSALPENTPGACHNDPDRKPDGKWLPGVKSPNPGGRPKRAPGFREDCRKTAEDLLRLIKERDWSGEYDGAALVQALKVAASLGGYMTADQEVRALVAIVKARKELTDSDWEHLGRLLTGRPAAETSPSAPRESGEGAEHARDAPAGSVTAPISAEPKEQP